MVTPIFVAALSLLLGLLLIRELKDFDAAFPIKSVLFVLVVVQIATLAMASPFVSMAAALIVYFVTFAATRFFLYQTVRSTIAFGVSLALLQFIDFGALIVLIAFIPMLLTVDKGSPLALHRVALLMLMLFLPLGLGAILLLFAHFEPKYPPFLFDWLNWKVDGVALTRTQDNTVGYLKILVLLGSAIPVWLSVIAGRERQSLVIACVTVGFLVLVAGLILSGKSLAIALITPALAALSLMAICRSRASLVRGAFGAFAMLLSAGFSWFGSAIL